MVVVPLPGSVIVDSIVYSRSSICDCHGYLQTDDSIEWDDNNHIVLSIAGQPVQANKLYQCAVPHKVLVEKLYAIKPLYQYALQPNKIRNPPFIVNVDSQIDLKMVFVQHYADKILAQISNNESNKVYDAVNYEKEWKIWRNDYNCYLSQSVMTTVVENSVIEEFYH